MSSSRRSPFAAVLAAALLAASLAGPLCRPATAGEPPAAPRGGLPPGPLFMGYYASWTEWPVAAAAATRLAALPDYLDIVAIGFARPDLVYAGGPRLTDSGLQTALDAPVLAEAVARLKARNPRLRVLLSVGGSGYAAGWANFAPEAIARLVATLGLDGVDLDYEPAAPGCAPARPDGHPTIVCAADADWAGLVRRMRAALPRPALLAVPGWSNGAYGQGDFAEDLPRSAYSGSMLWLGRATEAADIDLVTVMAYAAGPAYDPQRAFAAYRAIWPGPLLLGVLVPPDPTGAAAPTSEQLRSLAAATAALPSGGMMLYTLQGGFSTAAGPGMPSPAAASAARSICRGLGRTGCDTPLP